MAILPLVNLKMSEYGPPCVDEEETNVTPNKQYHQLLKDEYYEGCTTEIEGKTVNTEYRLVTGYTPVSEWTIFK